MCPEDDTIAALLEGRLPAREAAAVHAHAADCELCRQVIAEGARARSAIFRPPARRKPRSKGDATDAGEATESSPSPDEDEYWDLKTQGPLPRGFAVGRYTILEHLASGGMGAVYAAYDPDLDRRVALKVISTTSKIGSDDLRWRLLREAQAMARLSHPNVAVVHEVGTFSGQVFLAMEYVEGSTLREWLNQRARSWQEILGYFVQAGRGLAAAHARGLVHRDFKPDNVLLGEDGRVRVVDFGLVRPREDALGGARAPTLSTPLTEVGTLLGTPRYMAPEQMRGKTADGRTDQFGFCVALYEALFRVRPFGGETLHERLQQIDRGAFSPPAPGHGVPERIGAAVRRGLNPEPARRFGSMDDLLAVLEGVLQPSRGWRRVALVAAGVGAAAVVGGGGWVVMGRLDRCMSGDARLQRAWGPGQRTALPVLSAAGGPVLDAYAARWKMALTQACEVPRGGGEAARQELSTRLACLDRALGELGGTAAALSHGEPGALTRAGALPEPASCLERATAAAPGALNDKKRAELLRRVGELQARLDAGAAPVNELRALAEEAQPLPAAQAQALLLLGMAESRAHPREPFAEEAFHLAATAAQLSRDDGAAARAWLELSALCARAGSRGTEARRWAAYAQAAASRSAALADLTAQARQAVADAALAEGKLQEAVAEHRAAVAMLRARPQPEDALLAAVLLQGLPLDHLGKLEEALPDAASAARIRQAVLHDHPLTAEALEALAMAEERAGKWADAERDQALAVAIFDKALDPTDLRALRARVRLGALMARAGRHPAAVAMLGPAVGTLEREGSVEPLELAMAEQRLGRELLLGGDAAGAAATLERARNVLERSGPLGTAELPLTLSALGDARWTTGPRASARELLERAHATLPAQGGRPFDRAYAALLLARSLYGSPAAAERARALAQEGRTAKAALDERTWADERAALDALDRWLKEKKI